MICFLIKYFFFGISVSSYDEINVGKNKYLIIIVFILKNKLFFIIFW